VYKLLLCTRYLRTRYLAFICIVSVMLGVATLIVVNAVMSGFSTKLKDRLHGVLTDVVVETDRPDGFEIVREHKRAATPDELAQYKAHPDVLVAGARRPPPGEPVTIVLSRQQTPHALVVETCDGTSVLATRYLTPDGIMHEIRTGPAGDKVAAITPTIETFAVLQFRDRGRVIAKPVRLIGIDPEGRAAVGGFAEYLDRQKGAQKPSFELTADALQRHEWNRRVHAHENPPAVPPAKDQLPVPGAIPEPKMDIEVGVPKPKMHGVIVGHGLAHFRYHDKNGQMVEEVALAHGDNVILTTAGGEDLKPVWGSFYVTDYLKTEMSEYDSSYVYVPLDQLQRIRGMADRVTAFQIKLKSYDRDKRAVSAELRKTFPQRDSRVNTWEELQGPLLSAIEIERGILNVLLFMIVGVAGFSILAIFTMIVSEKYRDIGILKSLGASSAGVMSIFLGYGLLLGTVGCLLGTGLGLLITRYINEIEEFVTLHTGRAMFPKDIYYFKEIPTNVEPLNVLAVNLGAVLIATVFSLLPAWRAARLHPVRALRFE
jgi:lipoprotein-releasing system permease protein